MRLFSCQFCSQTLFFENVVCERCNHPLGFEASTTDLLTLAVATDSSGDIWRALGGDGRRFRYCANAKFGVCNWLVDADGPDALCNACRHNRVIPTLDRDDHRHAWRKIELAKHRLFYSLYRLGLIPKIDILASPEPLVFQFLADDPQAPPGHEVMTGHASGLITIALSEADDAERERRRKLMGEPYRTLLGHFRHEVGHYFWNKLVRDGGRLEQCRAIFGDDTRNYDVALKTYYDSGAPVDWQQHFVSPYATAHPWEDFAETWAHYLHIVDTLEMARAYGLSLAPSVDADGAFAVGYQLDPYDTPTVEPLIAVWLPVSTALNSLNRAMGKEELYPFVLSPKVIEKLGFMHDLVRSGARDAATDSHRFVH